MWRNVSKQDEACRLICRILCPVLLYLFVNCHIIENIGSGSRHDKGEVEMTDREFVLDAFLDDVIKVARVNLSTGEYAFVKAIDTPAEKESMEAVTIEGYFQNIITRDLIHPDDIESCRYHMRLDFLREKVIGRKNRFTSSFRYKMDKSYIWMTLEIFAPRDLDEENQWVVFCWSESDAGVCIMEDGMKKISGIYHKILKINLTTDSYRTVEEDGKVKKSSRKTSAKISRWFRKCARSGEIHKGDVKEYLAFTNLDTLRAALTENREGLHFRYRQKVGEVFHWFSMEFVPSVEYTDENQVVMLYIQDVHDEYVIETNHRRKLEYYANFDTLTGVWNHEYFYKRCKEYREGNEKYSVAVMYANINGMREINKKLGLEKGNEYIRSFAEMLAGEFGKNACYRMSGDEFLILFEKESERAVKVQFEAFRSILKEQELPMAAIGYVWAGAPDDFEDLLNDAENNMCLDKERYYKIINARKDNDNA